MSSVGRLIREARIKRGLTQKDISDLLGFTTPQFVSNLEHSKSPLPANLIPKLSKILKIPKRELIEAHLEDYRTSYASEAV